MNNIESGLNNRKYKLLVVDLEPAPYKVDLWNEFSKNTWFDIFVLYTTEKNWEPDAGHNFQELPIPFYQSTIFSGKGLINLIKCTYRLVSLILKWKPSMVFICGYVNALQLLSIVICVVLRKKYVVHNDIFNNGAPTGDIFRIKTTLRDCIRSVIFKTSIATLVCGKKGMKTAVIAGCPVKKIFDFPYVISRLRLQTDKPYHMQPTCRNDLESSNIVILFSGRMIPRKGLSTLLMAVAEIADIENWVLWVEGDGPNIEQYIGQANSLNIHTRCRFLGFCQMSLHSWLLRNSNIVVVPSFRDSWGIVVDEGMQLGKVVITSDMTGSGVDRIVNGENGLLFTAGNHSQLAFLLRMLIVDPEKMLEFGRSAESYAKKFSPEKNVNTLFHILKQLDKNTELSF